MVRHSKQGWQNDSKQAFSETSLTYERQSFVHNNQRNRCKTLMENDNQITKTLLFGVINNHRKQETLIYLMQQFVGNKPKGQISKGCCKKTKHAKFKKKKNIFYPLRRKRTCAYQGSQECLFFGKFSVLSFLVSSVMRFALLPYCRQIVFKHPPVRLKTPTPGRHLLV